MVWEAFKKIPGGKTTGIDGIVVVLLKSGVGSLIEWIRRIFKECMEAGKVPEFWKNVCIVILYKDKGSMDECAN